MLALQTPVSSLSLRIGEDGRLRLLQNSVEQVVSAVRCFPWTQPDKYISLRSEEGDELTLIVNPADLESASKEALGLILSEVSFLFDVVGILHVVEEVEIRSWSVQTKQGTRSFQTKREAWPQELPSGDFLVRDVAGDLYRITQEVRADPKSRKYLFAFVE